MFKYEKNNSIAAKSFLAGKRVVCVVPNIGVQEVSEEWTVGDFAVSSGNKFYVWVG